jgi:excinuclease ABC subunit B
MQRAIDETNRRRAIQQAYNEAHGITPQTIIKAQKEMLPHEKEAEAKPALAEAKPIYHSDDLLAYLDELEAQMKTAAQNLEFEKAAKLRDEIVKLKQQLLLAVSP